MTNGNGAPLENAAPPQFNVLAQYIKDFSFENPNSPASLAAQDKQPTINIQINVSATAVAEHDYEVSCRSKARPRTRISHCSASS
jgi:preprotein translocase subunit SecB